MKNKLPHAHTVKVQPSSSTAVFREVLAVVLRPILLNPPLYPFLIPNSLPKNVEKESIKVIQRYPTINYINEHGLPD